ncbi:MAG: sigma-70 family RNA polymerase sigma factor [Candidatus Cloacimonetes bacterium]|nr:sigma-70 family RNA polymerase sigma factor [Candidatus Cloacimonadota bacterium]
MNNNKFEVLLRNESGRLYNYLLKILRNKEDAEDILQETFIAFHKKMNSIKDSSYKSYLFRTAYHKALNLIKKRNAKNKLVTNFPEMEHFADGSTKNNEQQNELVKDALSKLKPEEALLIDLQFYQKMSYKQIAEVLETTQSAVDSKLVRAKKKLIKIITEQKKMQEK